MEKTIDQLFPVIFNFCIRERKVLGFIASTAAASLVPEIPQWVSRR